MLKRYITVMNAKGIAFLSFASLGTIAFPLAVSAQQYLFADGAYYYAHLIQFGRIRTISPRFLSLIITQFPALLSLQSRTSNLLSVSGIYGASLYYFPFICYAISVWLLFRHGMPTHAALLALMYTILIYYTSYFIISESHFSSGLFVLTISIISTLNMRKFIFLIVLVCAGIAALFCYEFWAVFFPICIVFFLYRIIGQETNSAIKLLQGLIVLLFIAGAILNTAAIIFPTDVVNRDAMFSTQMHNVWHMMLAACLFFGSAIFYGCFGSIFFDRLSQLKIGFKFSGPQLPESVLRLMLGGSIIIFFIFLYLSGIPKPQNAYALRSLNLFLPLLFSISFLVPRKESVTSASTAIALYCILPMLVLTMQASLYNTSKWLVFKDSLFAATQQQVGFVSINQVEISDPEFLWGWTTPTLSILLQAMQGRNIQSILFNPDAVWQPYGPSDIENIDQLVKGMQSNFNYIGTDTTNKFTPK